MSKTILLADDSLTIQKVVELTFAETDYDVVALSSGDDLLQQLPDVRPDLIICDIIMPGRDGYEVCQEIKSNPATLHIPVILLSGTFEPFDRDRALAAGCSEIITKPFEARKLVDTVQRLLAGGPAAHTPEAGMRGVEPLGVEPVVPPPPVPEPEPAPFVERTPAIEMSMPPELELHEEAAPPSPPSGAARSEFEGESEQGLDFTDTGFAEMEAADARLKEEVEEIPADGLDFEFSDDFEAFGESAEGEFDETPDTEPDVYQSEERSAGAAFVSAPIDVPPETETDVEPPPPAAPVKEPFPDTADDSYAGEPVTGPYEPFASGRERAGFRGDPEPPPSIGTPSPTEAEAVEPTAPSPAPWPGLEDELGTDAPEAEAPPIEEPAEDADVLDAAEGELSEADTAPLAQEAAVDVDREIVPPAPAALSDEDVDRIARRVLELAAERIEGIAWEVVPDMAEIVVRQRIRELESEAERTIPETPQ